MADASQRVVDLPALIVLGLVGRALRKVGLGAGSVLLLELVHKVYFLYLVLVRHAVVYDESRLVNIQVVLWRSGPLQISLIVPVPIPKLLWWLAMKSTWLR